MLFNPKTRYDLLMEAIGGTGVRAATPAELGNALNAAIQSKKPTLIEAIIDPAAGVESGRIGNLNIVSTVGKKK
jgi:oxalyl-CoA decarboxylase